MEEDVQSIMKLLELRKKQSHLLKELGTALKTIPSQNDPNNASDASFFVHGNDPTHNNTPGAALTRTADSSEAELLRKIAFLEQQLASRESALELATHSLRRIENMIAHERQEHERALHNALSRAEGVKHLKHRLDVLEGSLREQTILSNRLLEERNMLYAEKEDALKMYAKIVSEFENMQRSQREHSQKREEAEKKCHNLTETIKEVERTYQNLTNEYLMLQNTHQEFSRNSHHQKAMLEKAEREKAEREETLRILETRCTEHQQNAFRLEESLMLQKNQNLKTTNMNKSMLCQVEALTEELRVEREKWEKCELEAKKLRAEKEQSDIALRTLMRESERMAMELASIRDEEEKEVVRHEDLRQECERNKLELEKAKRECEQMESRHGELLAKFDAFEKELNLLRADGEQQESIILHLRSEKEELLRRVEQLQMEREEQDKILVTMTAETQQLEAGWKNALSECEQGERELRALRELREEQMQAVIEGCDAKLQSMKREAEERERALREEHRVEFNALVVEHELSINRLQENMARELETIREENTLLVRKLQEEKKQELEALQNNCDLQMKDIKEEKQKELETLCDLHEKAMTDLRDAYEKELRELREEEKELQPAQYEPHEFSFLSGVDEIPISGTLTPHQQSESNASQSREKQEMELRHSQEKHEDEMRSAKESYEKELQTVREACLQQVRSAREILAQDAELFPDRCELCEEKDEELRLLQERCEKCENELESSLKQFEEKLDALRETCEEHAKDAEAARAACVPLEQELSATRKECENLNVDIREWRRRNQSLNDRISNVTKECETLKRTLEDERGEHSEQLNNYKCLRCDKYKDELKIVEEQSVIMLQNAREKFEQSLEEAYDQVNDAARELCEEDMEKMRIQCEESLKEMRNFCEKAAGASEQEKRILADSLSKTQARCNELQEKLKKAEAQIAAHERSEDRRNLDGEFEEDEEKVMGEQPESSNHEMVKKNIEAMRSIFEEFELLLNALRNNCLTSTVGYIHVDSFPSFDNDEAVTTLLAQVEDEFTEEFKEEILPVFRRVVVDCVSLNIMIGSHYDALVEALEKERQERREAEHIMKERAEFLEDELRLAQLSYNDARTIAEEGEGERMKMFALVETAMTAHEMYYEKLDERLKETETALESEASKSLRMERTLARTIAQYKEALHQILIVQRKLESEERERSGEDLRVGRRTGESTALGTPRAGLYGQLYNISNSLSQILHPVRNDRESNEEKEGSIIDEVGERKAIGEIVDDGERSGEGETCQLILRDIESKLVETDANLSHYKSQWDYWQGEFTTLETRHDELQHQIVVLQDHFMSLIKFFMLLIDTIKFVRITDLPAEHQEFLHSISPESPTKYWQEFIEANLDFDAIPLGERSPQGSKLQQNLKKLLSATLMEIRSKFQSMIHDPFNTALTPILREHLPVALLSSDEKLVKMSNSPRIYLMLQTLIENFFHQKLEMDQSLNKKDIMMRKLSTLQSNTSVLFETEKRKFHQELSMMEHDLEHSRSEIEWRDREIKKLHEILHQNLQSHPLSSNVTSQGEEINEERKEKAAPVEKQSEDEEHVEKITLQERKLGEISEKEEVLVRSYSATEEILMDDGQLHKNKQDKIYRQVHKHKSHPMQQTPFGLLSILNLGSKISNNAHSDGEL